ncbi:hypothetical protein EDB92DRAFT_196297 [Lactarius akahatsu]|uniref:WW domain-containing protein n=1 Tax=Lactarius akahatsu TaxID=416441 RepID=A0AAD4QFB5_9AGAM|nr:hypothetical protein EDB92DRAFT_196297 [Lactarius akahatsu]
MPVFRSGLGLLALVRAIRSIGYTLKSFILRCVLFWPHVLHNFGHIWPLCSQTGLKGAPKTTGGQERPSFPKASGMCEEYSTVYASRDFNRANDSVPRLPLGSGNAEDLHLSSIMVQSSASTGSTHSIADSNRSGTQLPIRLSNNSLTLTHSRATSTQFAGILQDTSEGYRRPEITTSPLSRSQTADDSQRHSTPNPSDPEGFSSPYLVHENARHSGRRLPTSTPVSSSNQAQHQFPFLWQSQVSLRSGPDGKMRSIGLIHPEQVRRYVNKGISLVDSNYRLRPMEVDLPPFSYAKCPGGWVPATHPGGSLYFYNPERRIFTDVYMYDVDLSAEIHAFAALLDKERTEPLPTDDYDLVLDIKVTDDETVWAYYYVDHASKTLFWQDFYECGDSLLRGVRGVREPGHVKLRLESLYWTHWSLYPGGPDWRRFPRDASNELYGALVSSGIDAFASQVLTLPYTVAEIESLRGFIKAADNLGPENPHAITSIAQLLSFYSFHGRRTSHKGRTILVRILSPPLFFFPYIHLRELEKVLTDVEAYWKGFMQKLVSEWTEFVLYSTVMLAANVAFLAIPGVIVVPQNTSPPNAWILPSPAQMASSISLVFSIGSVITGLLLIRRNRNMMTKDPQSALRYLHRKMMPRFGLEPLAIVFSLTYALLMWSVGGFFVALLIFSFQDTTREIWISVGTAAGIVAILIVWCIKNTWDPVEGEEPIDLPYERENLVGNGAEA